MGFYANPSTSGAGQAVLATNSQTANFTATANTFYSVSASSAAVTVTLPTSSQYQSIVVKKTDSSTNAVTLSGTINGTASSTLALSRQNQTKRLYADASGGGWTVIDGDVDLATINASATSAGLIQLAGDLGGTAASPTTPTAVHLAGAETITGVKTFSASPKVPTPTNTTDAANKSYIDSALSSVTSSVVSQSQLTSYAVDPSTIGATISGTNGITVTESGNNITIGYSGGSGGTSSGQIRTVTSDGAVTSTDSNIFINAASNNVTLTLPTAASVSGQRLFFKRLDSSSYTVTIDPNGSETIDGYDTLTLGGQFVAATIVSNGSQWFLDTAAQSSSSGSSSTSNLIDGGTPSSSYS